MKARIFITAAFLGMFIVSVAQNPSNGSIAKLNYNADKSGNLNASIHFNSSFFINNFTTIPSNLSSIQDKLLAANTDFKKIQLTAMDDKKTVMVVIDLSTNGKLELSRAFKELFIELGVETVELNGASINLNEFKF